MIGMGTNGKAGLAFDSVSTLLFLSPSEFLEAAKERKARTEERARVHDALAAEAAAQAAEATSASERDRFKRLADRHRESARHHQRIAELQAEAIKRLQQQ